MTHWTLRLVVHVLYKLDALVVRRNQRAFLVSLVTHVEILHITMIYPVIFMKYVKWILCIKECISRNTYPQFGLDPLFLVVEAPAIPIELIGGVGIVLPCPGRLVPSTNVDYAREVIPAQSAQDAVDLALVSTSTEYFPIPAKSD